MKITNRTISPCVLGLLAALGSPLFAGSDDPRVYSIELPLGNHWFNSIMFSGDGSTIAYTSDHSASSVYTDQGNGWDLRQQFPGNEYGSWLFGMSDDGRAFGVWEGFGASYLHQGAGVLALPSQWDDALGHSNTGNTLGTAISGNGQTVALSGHSPHTNNTEALLWRGGSELVNISAGFQNQDADHRVSALSSNGSVAAGTSWFFGPMNDLTSVGTNRESWVWTDGAMAVIPNLDLGFDATSSTIGLSGNGEAVIGGSQGLWSNPDYDWTNPNGELPLIHGNEHAWIWTQTYGTVEIGDSTRFSDVFVRDITDDGATVLGGAIDLDDNLEQFLWTRNDGFVMIEDLFDSLGITIDADSYSFSQISGDGTKLMGLSYLDDQVSALVVTVPAPSGMVLCLVGMFIGAWRRR